MRPLSKSDLFETELNRNNFIMGRLNAILTGMENTKILNEVLYTEIKKKIVDKRRSSAMNEMLRCIQNGRMILFVTEPEKKLSDMIPFFVYKQNGLKKVCVNLTTVIHMVSVPGDATAVEYELGDGVNKISTMLYAAYLALDRFDEKTALSSDLMYYSAVLWAEMFTKPLFNIIGLNNMDRRVAFLYFSMKFFMMYFMETDEAQADATALRYIQKKNTLILYMEEKISEKQINIARGVKSFLTVLFDSEITMIKGLRTNMNLSFYLSEFVKNFGSNALLSLCSYPYFVYVILAAYNKTRMLKDKSFDRIFQTNTRETNKLMVDLLKE